MDDSLINYRSLLIAEDADLRHALEIISDEELSALRDCGDYAQRVEKSDRHRVNNADDVDELFG